MVAEKNQYFIELKQRNCFRLIKCYLVRRLVRHRSWCAIAGSTDPSPGKKGSKETTLLLFIVSYTNDTCDYIRGTTGTANNDRLKVTIAKNVCRLRRKYVLQLLDWLLRSSLALSWVSSDPFHAMADHS